MGYLGLVPSESSTGDTVNRGGITRAGNGRARRILVEAAWSYRYPPRVSREKQMKVAAEVRAGPRQGELPSLLCGRSHDRRPISDRDSPGRTNGNAVSNPRIRA